jgi:hypothetical protein
MVMQRKFTPLAVSQMWLFIRCIELPTSSGNISYNIPSQHAFQFFHRRMLTIVSIIVISFTELAVTKAASREKEDFLVDYLRFHILNF